MNLTDGYTHMSDVHEVLFWMCQKVLKIYMKLTHGNTYEI